MSRGFRTNLGGRAVATIVVVLTVAAPSQALAQLRGLTSPPSNQPAPTPPMPVGPEPIPIGPPSAPPGASLLSPGPGAPPAPLHTPPMGGAVAQPAPMVPAGQVALILSARYGRDAPIINGGLQWRIYASKPDQTGTFRLIKEDRGAAPTLILPPGTYVVHCGFGLATAVRRVELRSETVREVFELPAGGLRIEGKVGEAKIPRGLVTFDVFKGSQFDPGDKVPIAAKIAASDVIVLPEGTYHIVSTYGDANATVRSDIRVQTAKLTDVTINHRAAKVMLKLVSEKGGEALANTDWEVLTPAGDVITESKGAFPVVVLAEGDYIVIARNEGKVFNREFKVEPGADREVEVVAR